LPDTGVEAVDLDDDISAGAVEVPNSQEDHVVLNNPRPPGSPEGPTGVVTPTPDATFPEQVLGIGEGELELARSRRPR
jgi:hypothetical protein